MDNADLHSDMLRTFDPKTATKEQIVEAQTILRESGMYHGAVDGLWGPLSQGALNTWRASHGMAGKLLHGDGTWPWFAQIDGDDIIVQGAIATAFGGDDDKMDSGETASGFNTKGHPNLIAVSLPMNVPGIKELRGSPIPRMPFGLHRDGTDNPDGAHVDVTFFRARYPREPIIIRNVPVVDLGPAKATGHSLDCSVALARLADRKATANSFTAKADYRILRAAKYVT